MINNNMQHSGTYCVHQTYNLQVSTAATTHLLSQLDADTEYVVRVMAVGTQGLSLPTVPLYFRTYYSDGESFCHFI